VIKKLKLLPLILVPLLLFGGGYAFASGSLPGGVNVPFLPKPAATPDAAAAAAEAAKPKPAVPVTTGERVVNLADAPNMHYLKTEVVLSVALGKDQTPPTDAATFKTAQEEQVAGLAQVMPAIQDIITTELTRRTSAEVASAEGKDKLKADLLDRINQLPLEHPVTAVYFTQFVVQ
jgi:flagellar FliL protein